MDKLNNHSIDYNTLSYAPNAGVILDSFTDTVADNPIKWRDLAEGTASESVWDMIKQELIQLKNNQTLPTATTIIT